MAAPTQHLSAPTHHSEHPPPLPGQRNNGTSSSVRRGIAPSQSSTSLAFPQSVTMQNLGAKQGAPGRNSRTWTASSGDLGLLSDTDELEDRAAFVLEYNRLAKKHGVRVMVLEDFEGRKSSAIAGSEKRGWLHRLFRSSSNDIPAPVASALTTKVNPRHRRSVSDIAHNLALSRREWPQTTDLQTMVRISGKSVLYLPSEHASGPIVLPTCIRATAQHLAHHAMTRGIFRIPGSVKIVNALFDYYCYVEGGGARVSGTVRCVNLPMHIQSSVHDVASTFKKMLSVLPGGILGSLAVFDAMVAIHSQLNGSPEFPRTKQTRVRARLIALAIATIKSQFRRDLICAVFGLLSLIGRVAEVTPREDDEGRALPTADLMGYNALGIVFGPLLIGELMDDYTMKIADPGSGLMLFPVTPQKMRRDRRKSKPHDGVPPAQTSVDKVRVANGIAEMLITNWRDVIRQLKALGTHEKTDLLTINTRAGSLRPSASATFVIRKPRDWDHKTTQNEHRNAKFEGLDPSTPTAHNKRQRSRNHQSATSANMAQVQGVALSPTFEEIGSGEQPRDLTSGIKTSTPGRPRDATQSRRNQYEHELLKLATAMEKSQLSAEDGKWREKGYDSSRQEASESAESKKEIAISKGPQVSVESVPPRTSSRPRQPFVRIDRPELYEKSSSDDKHEDGNGRSSNQKRGRQNSRRARDGQSMETSPLPLSRRKRPASRPTPHSSRTSRSKRYEASAHLEHSPYLYDEKSRGLDSQETSLRRERRHEGHGSLDHLTGPIGRQTRPEEAYNETAADTNDQKTTYDYFYLSPKGDVERLQRPHSPEQVRGHDETPRQSYAAMRTPSTLLKLNEARRKGSTMANADV
ncbi:hypothetical protein CC79DRAFT_1373340 [Sarocladium strictum]